MQFDAKSAAPHPAHVALHQPVLDRAAEGVNTLFTASAGYLLDDSLAAALAERGRPTLWLRLGPEDRDPATFLVSLINGARRLCPGVGTATLEQMRRKPGSVACWPPLFAHLAQELTEALPASGVMVLQNVHYLNDAHLALGWLGSHLLSALRADVTCILTSSQPLPRAALPAQTNYRGVADLRLDVGAAMALSDRTDARLSAACVRRAVALTDGRAGALVGLYAACPPLGSKFVEQAVSHAVGVEGLLASLVHAWLTTADTNALQALALAMRIEYSHPALVQAVLGKGAPQAGPWLQPLADDWMRVHRLWRAPLGATLSAQNLPGKEVLHRTADYLIGQGATEQAVPLYLELGEVASAVQAIAQSADTLMNLGQWETLGQWVEQLPASALHDWPRLVYIGGEIAAAQGRDDAARRAFATSTALFKARHDTGGACQSLLAESAIASWHGDGAQAQADALTSSAMAEAAGLAVHRGWADWQLGCLAAASGKLDDALACFDRAESAVSAAGDSLMLDLVRQVKTLTSHQSELRRQSESHRQAHLSAERAEREAAERLKALLGAPPDNLGTLLENYGWSRTPLMLKLPTATPSSEVSDVPQHTGLWEKLLTAVGLHRQLVGQTAGTAKDNSPSLHTPLAAPAATDHMPIITTALPTTSDTALTFEEPTQVQLTSSPDLTAAPVQSPTLTAHLLGEFRVSVNEQPVEKWPSGRGRAVLKYLLIHHNQPTPRDVLMDVFWSDASSEAARNRLHVALHSLRQGLRAVTDMPVVIFQDGEYCLNPDLHLWVDVDEFDHHVETGRRLEVAGQIATAAAEYELAIGLYQGDLLADDPYEEWPVLTRERLRVAYLDTLDRLSHIYLDRGQYAACETLCQLILARDNCREDAHCLLMRCYSRQDQYHLALRQYQACVEALHTELDVAPAPATMQLYERIRRHERI